MTAKVPAARRTRAQLDRQSILDAVLRLSADPAAGPITVRRLGLELGADPTAIYRHFRDKDALVRDAVDRLLARVHEAVPADADWRTRLRVTAERTLEVLAGHPALGARAGALTTGGEHELAAVELMLSAFREAGLGDVDAVRYYAMFSSYTLAFAAAQAGSRLDPEGVPDEAGTSSWLADYSAVDPDRYPAVAALQPALVRLQDREVFMTGVDIILESAARQGALRGTRTTGP